MVNQFNRSGSIVVAALCSCLSMPAMAQHAPLPLETLRQLADVYGLIKSDYVEPVDDRKLLTEAINGMLAALDPNAVYLDRTAFKAIRAAKPGQPGAEFGLDLVMQEGYLKVVAPLDDSAFAKAGVLAGDLIVRINGVPLQGLSFNDALEKLRKAGRHKRARIVLGIARKGVTLSVAIACQALHVPGVKTKMIAPGYAWLRIARFQDATVGEMAQQVKLLYGAHVPLKGIVLDVRNAAGGAVRGAIGVSALFLPKDALITSTRGQLPQSNRLIYGRREFYAQQPALDPLALLNPLLKRVPLVVLVNTGSASSAEIVAGALQDHQRATIVGTATFGKASVQSVLPLGSDTAVRLTTALYYTPHGHVIEAHGIVPDLQVDDTASALAAAPADGTALAEQNRRASRPQPQPQPQPVYGSAADFQLAQALNHLKGLPVILSKIALLSKAAESAAAAKPDAGSEPESASSADQK